MDPFTEKEIVDCLKSIALSLRNMDRKMDDVIRSIQDFGADMASSAEDELEESDSEEKTGSI